MTNTGSARDFAPSRSVACALVCSWKREKRTLSIEMLMAASARVMRRKRRHAQDAGTQDQRREIRLAGPSA